MKQCVFNETLDMLISGPARRFKRLCEQFQTPLLTGNGVPCLNLPSPRVRTSSAVIPAPNLVPLRNPDLRATSPSTSSANHQTPLSHDTDDGEQKWAFIDSGVSVDSLTPVEAANSISTLCLQFEATMAVSDNQLESIIPAEQRSPISQGRAAAAESLSMDAT